MSAEILINIRPTETRVAYVENGVLTDLKVERKVSPTLVGSIHLGKVSRVLPGMQAAFVDIGLDRAAFLYVGDIRDDIDTNESLYIANDGDKEESSMEFLLEDQDEGFSKNEEKQAIQDLLREGQNILVQVSKDPLGTKGARITTHISLAGRLIVYMPTTHHLGISRRIEKEEERERLKETVLSLKPNGGVIVRTACEDADRENLQTDLNYLEKLWTDVYNSYQKKKNPGVIYSEMGVELRALRDLLTSEVKTVYVDEGRAYKRAVKFVGQFMPRFKNKMTHYQQRQPLFDMYDLDHEISRSIARKVWLKSGGYIVFDEAEALVVVDVNTGRFVGKRDFEETIVKTNLEAAKEVAHQLKIRNCGGIIIVDFIDMENAVHREMVLDMLELEFKTDPARTNVLGMSELGLVEMTRKRTRPSLIKTLCSPCSYCDGRGYIKTCSSVVGEVFRAIQREASWGVKKNKTAIVRCHRDVVDWVYGEEAESLEELENRTGWAVTFKMELSYHREQHDIEYLDFNYAEISGKSGIKT